ncbi:aminomethyltransferase [Natronocella acetinitrilica]|uniref:Aminomethyltransferase n=1 Tax=Natronocella acetinitrilica TaxID=414046 RepID=A0AAE3G887_9GAMM|nr:glycine cleavage system aminomethyltransferase GcvT [Natronocella acetinitrilica]MCP1676814.1 aminomethyltransferase [Natronocella acetinitrilica]
MLRETALHERHRQAGGKMVPFAGWDMPLHYGSQLEEHRHVRSHAGMFDVSHMTVVDVTGADARAYLQRLLANDVARLSTQGQAMYTCMLNADAGIIDDLIVYFLSEGRYRTVVNAATRETDLAWMEQQAEPFDVRVRERASAAMLAVQGPEAVNLLSAGIDSATATKAAQLKPFHSLEQGDLLIARTGYTGEDGFELIVPERQVVDIWDHLVEAGVRPCGLGARDSLRLEAGLCLYGQDMDQSTSPLTSNLAWTVAWEPDDRRFIGRTALEKERDAGPEETLLGIVLRERGMLRHDTVIRTADGSEGHVTSGGFSPMLGCSIALARLPMGAEGEATALLRSGEQPVRVVQPPFVRRGKILVN